ncbi:MAG TPA: PAS domain-containing sensor histidine kinase, partial [Prolixibacteraceae bacterium]|nr:PAS domain-containing sensor histidine kinase [Prolixibacteraceae bacterium]
IFGVGSGGLVGMNLNQFISAEQFKLVQNETALRVNGIRSVYELDILRSNNELRTIIITAVPQLDKKGNFIGTYGVFRDITQRKQAEKALHYEQYLLHTLMNNVPEHIYFKDCESGFIRINKAQARLFGLSDPEQAIGKTDFDFFTNEHASQAFEDEQEIIRTGQPISKEERETWENHPDTWVLTTKMPLIDSNKKIIGTFGISMNIDDRKKAEVEIRLKNEELHKINLEKDKFFSIIAHDLRSPFNGFLGLTELMVEDLPTMSMADIKKIALIMRTSATNLFSLLGNLLEWSSMQRGLSTFSFESFLLKPRISESMVFVMDGANKKGITVSYNVPVDLEVYADRNMVGGIIRNIASNAVKFTNKGGNIAISAKTVAANFVEISIKDSGIGMKQEMINHLFSLDVNTRRSGTEGECSTGLGLILCKDFIEKHGGKLWVESIEETGSTFRFTLPGRMKE